MFNTFLTISIPYAYVEYTPAYNIDKNDDSSYNTIIGDEKMKKNDDDIFIPTKEQMEAAQERLKERAKQGTTKGYNKYFKKLMRSFADIKNGGE